METGRKPPCGGDRGREWGEIEVARMGSREALPAPPHAGDILKPPISNEVGKLFEKPYNSV